VKKSGLMLKSSDVLKSDSSPYVLLLDMNWVDSTEKKMLLNVFRFAVRGLGRAIL